MISFFCLIKSHQGSDCLTININETILSLVTKDSNLKDILNDLGFKEIVKPGMIQTVGRFMTLKAGSSMRNIELSVIVKTLEDKGYIVEGV